MGRKRSISLLTQEYKQLNSKERRLMRVIAVIQLTLNVTNVRAIIKALNTSTENLSLPDGFSALQRDRLIKSGLLEDAGHSSRFICSDALTRVLIQETIASDEYSTFASIRTHVSEHASNRLRPESVELSRTERMHLTDALAADSTKKQFRLTKQCGGWLNDPSHHKYAAAHEYVSQLFMENFDSAFFIALPENLQQQAIESTVESAFISTEMQKKERITALKQWIKHSKFLQNNGTQSPAIANALIQWEWQFGSFGVSEVLLGQPINSDFWRHAPYFPEQLLQHWRGRLLNAWHAHIRGEHEYAINEYERAQTSFQQLHHPKDKHLRSFYGFPAFGHYLSLYALSQHSHDHLRQLNRLLNTTSLPFEEIEKELFTTVLANLPGYEEKRNLCGWSLVVLALQILLESPNLQLETDHIKLCILLKDSLNLQPLLVQWLTCVHQLWKGEEPDTKDLKNLLNSWLNQYSNTSMWMNGQIHSLMAATLCKKSPQLNKKINKLPNGNDEFPSLVQLIEPKPAWQKALNDLKALAEPKAAATAEKDANQNARIIWNLSKKHGEYLLTPREQKRLKTGNWGKGRVMSLHRLVRSNDYTLPPISSHDQKIIDCIEDYSNTYWREEYVLNQDAALVAAIGHPRIFWETPPNHSEPNRTIDIVKKDVALEVHEQKNGFLLQLNYYVPPELDQVAFLVKEEGSHRLVLVNMTPQHANIARVIGEQGLSIPKEAKEQVLDSINSMAPLITIESDLGSHNSEAVSVTCDPRLHIQVTPQSDGDLNFRVGVKPLGEHGQLFMAGKGRRHITGDIQGNTYTTERDLTLELNHWEMLQDHCPDFTENNHDPEQNTFKINENEWRLPEENALSTLLNLQKLHEQQPEDFELFWPQGQKLKINRPADLSKMQLSVTAQKDWFALEGELQLDEKRVVSMNQLMTLLQHHSGKFIPLGDNEFITLTDQLRKRLDTLSTQGTKQQYHPLALHYLEGVTEGMNLQGDGLWQEQKSKIKNAYESLPQLPKTLEASLRDYQQEGFEWMARLSQWGGGACLADDMGLGKTLQCLTLILSRASQGPTLVVAPTSVCMNWIREAARFTPTLSAVYFGDSDRENTLKNASAMDVVVCSYGLLTHEAKLLQSVHWNTIVVDEAQALKNPVAKRSQILFGMNADCKIAATGTPIENHLGELWSLFHFINPGLLGSRENFNQRFATPIEQQKDEGARDALRRLVQPFILRRLKNDVLTELPSRTEITRKIAPSEDEQVFYEALRRQALNNLSQASDHAGKKRMQALAEIMKLRRACCNPKLVLPNSKVASSKFAAFIEIFTELKENNHRVLVFSQFVDHLGIIKDFFEKQQIPFQYLDGSTPIKKRNQAVKAFQQGEGDAFLISLKAGGSGLNLTAADYVIHMDPWWNPAVEDQASDRAHRMGQTRPVTIYRLVAEGTIEEKILDLHQQKRDLADSLLEGSDMGGALSADQIIGLIEAEV